MLGVLRTSNIPPNPLTKCVIPEDNIRLEPYLGNSVHKIAISNSEWR